MKKSISIFLLFVFSFNLVGVVTVFKLQQLQIRQLIKRKIRRGISEEELHEIVVTTQNRASIIWKGDDEFTYRNRMYDVVRKEMRNDTTVVYFCINDKQEEILFANLDNEVKKSLQKDNPASRAAKKIFSFLSYFHTEKIVKSTFLTQHIKVLARQLDHRYLAPCIANDFPPPEA